MPYDLKYRNICAILWDMEILVVVIVGILTYLIGFFAGYTAGFKAKGERI